MIVESIRANSNQGIEALENYLAHAEATGDVRLMLAVRDTAQTCQEHVSALIERCLPTVQEGER